MTRNKSHYQHLKEKWINKHKKLQKKLWNKHKDALSFLSDSSKQLALGSVGGLMLLTSPVGANISSQQTINTQTIVQNVDKSVFLISDLSHVLPDKVRPLTFSEEDVIAQTLSRHFGMRVTPVLQDKRLNRSYGLIGAEQHLARFPGDNMNIHFDNNTDAQKYWSSGMAPGLGGWGYFVKSQSEFSEKDKMREKYYIAVQTFLSEDFNKRVKEYMDFYKYRKMLVVNPNNGKAIVTDIADSGPSVWTGKHLGGSPEVMNYLERFDGAQKGPVLYLFIDDPDDKILLGPINVQ
ncbi:MAG: hypothetical protein Q7K55_08545 [Candidatus Levybacteria bacterium]|nr:hypothetical protein [Candidatus Levybacteria bacterium]